MLCFFRGGVYFKITFLKPLTLNREEKSLPDVAMVAKFLDLNKPWSCKHGRNNNKKLTCLTFLCMIALGNKAVPHNILPSFDNANGRPYQERLLRSKNFASMVT